MNNVPTVDPLTTEAKHLTESVLAAVQAIAAEDDFLATANDCDAKRNAVMAEHGKCMQKAMTIFREDDEDAQKRWFQAKQICYNMITKVMAECSTQEL